MTTITLPRSRREGKRVPAMPASPGATFLTAPAARKAAKTAANLARRLGWTDECDRRRWQGERVSVTLHNGWGGLEVTLDGQTVVSTAWASGEVRLHPGAHPEQLGTVLQELLAAECPLCRGAGSTLEPVTDEDVERTGCPHPIHRQAREQAR